MKGRYIGENVRLLEEILEYVETNKEPCIMFFSDFEKAFDSVDHTYLLKTLQHFNFGDSLLQWITTFYKDAHSSVLINGFLTDAFKIERGVRQGCPLSPYLFIIAIELLSNRISKHPDIKGIQMNNVEIKNTLFADDATFITDGKRKSFETLIDVLDDFEKNTGLRLNNSKCHVLRAGASKPNTIKYCDHKSFQWSSNNAKALGITFTTNRTLTLKLNLDPKIEEFKTCLKQWQHRKLTLLGKVTVIKTFALPKLIYPLTVLKTPPPATIKYINDIMYNFLWENKPGKIKRDTLTKDYEEGGIKMIDIQKFINSIKCSWVKRIFELNDENPLKHIILYLKHLNKFGGKLIFECNLTEDDLKRYFNANTFLSDILIAWRKIFAHQLSPFSSKTVIWNNSLIRAGNKPLFYKRWSEKGITTLGDIFDLRTHTYYTFDMIKFLYNIPNEDFMKYLSLKSSIPSAVKTHLTNENNTTLSTTNYFNKVLTCQKPTKFLYTYQIKSNDEPITQTKKWENIFGNEHILWKSVFKLPYDITVNNKLRNFNYKYIMRIVRTNKELFKFKLVNSSLCDFCFQSNETALHLFWECTYAQELWRNIANIFRQNNINIVLNFRKISLGILNQNYYYTPLNYIILLAKYFIFRCKCLKETPHFNHFKYYMHEQCRIEKHIAQRKGKISVHNAKWDGFKIDN